MQVHLRIVVVDLLAAETLKNLDHLLARQVAAISKGERQEAHQLTVHRADRDADGLRAARPVEAVGREVEDDLVDAGQAWDLVWREVRVDASGRRLAEELRERLRRTRIGEDRSGTARRLAASVCVVAGTHAADAP